LNLKKGDGQGGSLNAYGISITGIDVTDPFIGIEDYANHDPIESTAGWGYSRSVENNIPLDTMKAVYPKGEKCVVGGAVCYPYKLPPMFSWWYRATTPLEPVIEWNEGAIDFVKGAPGKLYDWVKLGTSKLLSLSASYPVGQEGAAVSADNPAYITVQLQTTDPVNVLRFAWSFDAGGEGLVRVFVDGDLVHEIDQRYVSQASLETEEVFIGGSEGLLQPGVHVVGFRLDGFGEYTSDVYTH
jgi:hypothetical protein